MKLHCDKDSDCLYFEFCSVPGVETREVFDGLVVDLDAVETVAGFDINQAFQHLDVSTLETEAPASALSQSRMKDNADTAATLQIYGGKCSLVGTSGSSVIAESTLN